MSYYGQAFASLLDVFDLTVPGGYLLALALVCLIQYLFYLHRQSEARRQNERSRQTMDGLEDELLIVNKERMIGRLENHLLREFIAQTSIEQSLGVLLRHYVPAAGTGFAAFINSGIDQDVVIRSRGLSDESLQKFSIDKRLRERASKEGLIVVSASELRESQFFNTLSRSDKRKAKNVYFSSMSESDGNACFFITTSLYPSGATPDQQIELTKRLMQSVTGNMKRSQVWETQEDQHRIANDIIELRSISDQQFETPIIMLEKFLERLVEKTGADRATLYLLSEDRGVPKKALIRCGKTLQPRQRISWRTHENVLAAASSHLAQTQVFHHKALFEMGIHSLIQNALVAPLIQNQDKIGILCYSKQSNTPFLDHQIELTKWASQFLAGTIHGVLAHAKTVQHARQDGLTELANRREFDLRIAAEMKAAARNDKPCSLLLLDLDRFKQINDTYGHQAGDDVLRSVAEILKGETCNIRSNDRVLTARYGGEEMAVLLPEIGLTGAKRIAESIRRSVEKTSFEIDNHSLNVTISVGIACFPDLSANVQELVAVADAALYQAKQMGRNRVCCAGNIPV